MEYAVIEKKNPVMILFLILAILTLSTGILIRLSTTDQPTDAPPQIHDETDINWAAPPCNPDNLSVDWKEITDARMLKNSSRRVFQYRDTKWKIAFDKGDCGMPGFKGRDHWHRYNPFSTNENDFYLDQRGNPTGKNKTSSHIPPNCS